MALIPPRYLDTVVAIGIGDDPADRKWIGTGFLYGLFEKKESKNQSFYTITLVSNAHVFGDHKMIWLKFNDKTGSGSRDYPIQLVAKNGRNIWSRHPTADVAAMLIDAAALKKDSRKFSFFQSDTDCIDVAGLKSIGASEGDGVFLLGFPLGYVDPNRLYVICRSGAVARIRDVIDGNSDEYLVDALIFPGNSGGPTVSRPEVSSIRGTTANDRALLMGIVQNYLPYRDTAISIQTGQPRITFEENSGLTSIIPTDFVEATAVLAKKVGKNRIAQARYRAKKAGSNA